MAKFEEFFYESKSGKNKIHAVKCIPEGEIRGIVQIAHGISEHIGRYTDFMTLLADNGFLAVGNDHLGHGKSAANEKEKGIFCKDDGWKCVTDDMVTLHDMTAKVYPGLKYILFGHSMGSFLTRTYIADHPDKYDLVILSGTGHQGRLLIKTGNVIAELVCKVKGFDSDGTMLNKIAMGSYLKKIENPRTPFDWLSRDTDRVDSYAADDMCGFTTSSGVYRDMMYGIKYVTDEKTIAKVDKTKPVLFISGDCDPVGEYGAGVRRAYGCFKSAGVKDVTMKLYDGGRHEMLNETNRDEASEYILSWINERM